MKKKIVIKLGGSSLQNPATLAELSSIIRGFQFRNYSVILVHGGGPAINAELLKKGISWKFINGQRQTTAEMMSVIEETLAGVVNSKIVAGLNELGISAVGLSGAQGILQCRPQSEELGLVGHIEKVDTQLIDEAVEMETSPVPVIAPIGIGGGAEREDLRQAFNINADWAATQIAIALGAKKLIFLTDQNGILNEKQKPLHRADPQKIHEMIQGGIISGGMCTKVLAMMSALDSGVEQVRVLNASDSSRVFGKARIGTILSMPAGVIAKKGDSIHVHAS